jgi:hypothetical protein
MKDIPGQRMIPCTYHSFIVLGYPIPGFLILGYLSLSQKTQRKVIPIGYPRGYPAPGHIPGLSLRYPIDISKQADLS